MTSASTTPKTTMHVRQAIGGDAESLGWVFGRFTPLVEAQVRMRLGAGTDHHDVEDVVADTWVVTLQRMRDLSPREGRFAPVLLRFLGTTAIQLCNNHLRSRIRDRRRRGDPPSAEATVATDPLADVTRQTLGVATRVGRNEIADAVRKALANLEDEKRELLILRVVEGHSNQEIAQLLDERPNTIAVRYRRALDALRATLPRQVLRDILGL